MEAVTSVFLSCGPLEKVIVRPAGVAAVLAGLAKWFLGTRAGPPGRF